MVYEIYLLLLNQFQIFVKIHVCQIQVITLGVALLEIRSVGYSITL